MKSQRSNLKMLKFKMIKNWFKWLNKLKKRILILNKIKTILFKFNV